MGRANLLGRMLAFTTPSPTLVLFGIILLIAGFATLYPAIMLLRGTLSTGTITSPSPLTLQNYVSVYGSLETYRLLWTTVLYALATSVVSVLTGFILAWISVRTNTPLAQHMGWLVIVPYAIPNTLTAIAWILLANPNTGVLNELARTLTGSQVTPFNVYSFGGMVFVTANHSFALAFTLLAAALHSMDPALEEAGYASGAGPFRVAGYISVPLAKPAILSTLAMLFILLLEAFDTPTFIGIPAKIYVFSTQVFLEISLRIPPDYGRAATYGVLPLILALVLAYFYRRTLAQPERYAVISGKAYRPRRVDLGPWRWLTFAVFLFVFFLTGILPLLTLLVVSLAPTLLAAKEMSLSSFGLQHYWTVFTDPVSLRAIRNTLTLGLLGASLAMVVAFFLAFVTTRAKIPARGLIEYLVFVPFSFAGVVLAIGILWGYIRFPIAVYGTIWILLIAYVTKFLPYGLRSMSASFLQVHRELEEAAQLSGAGLGRILRSILLPLTLPGFVAGWSLLVVVFMREFSMSLLLWSTGSEVLTVLFYDHWTNARFGQLSALGIFLVTVSLAIVFAARRVTRLDAVG